VTYIQFLPRNKHTVTPLQRQTVSCSWGK